MSIEDIKAELAKLEPEANALWDEYQRLEALAQPAKEQWYPVFTRCKQLRAALELMEPKEESQ